MKFLLLILFFTTQICFAQGRLDMNPMVDREQSRIDNIDFKIDNKLRPNGENDQWELYQKVYFTDVDSMQNRINLSKNLMSWQKKNLLYGLSLTLSEINNSTYNKPLYYQKLLQNAAGMIGAIERGDLASFLITDPLYSIKNIYFYMYDNDAKPFLLKSASIYPDEVLKNFYKYKERDYKDTIIEICAVVAPNVTKNYLIAETEIKEILKKNTNYSVMGMNQFFKQYNILSKGMVLVDDIIEGKITFTDAHVISLDKRKFLRKMIEIRNQPYAHATYSLDDELHLSALEYVRTINDLHNEPNPKIRFKSIDDFNWKELYTLMVYSEEEIFTSSFNGVFERLMYRLKEDQITGDRMLKEMGYNRFRIFLKLCAGYGKLNDFLKTMSVDNSRALITKFTNNLDDNSGELRSAINVADAFGSINDSSLLKLIRNNVLDEYKRVSVENSRSGIAIYGLLKSLFVDQKQKDKSWYNKVSENYKLERIDVLPIDKMKGFDKIHRQVHFFYDDEDGDVSFSSFLQTFNTPYYKIIKKPNYVIIESTKGNKIKIYANQPKSELDGQADLIALMDSFKKDVQVMVHRGHSYYAMNTIVQMPPTTKIVFLGSCGSYHNMHEVLGISQNVHIISSKQIGTMTVNNPLLFLITETVRENKDIVWDEIWKKLETKIATNKYAMDKFIDYVPPHKNLGAIFLQAYTKVVTQ